MVQAAILIQDDGDTFSDCDHLVDGAGNRFVAYGEMGQGPIEGNKTWVTIKRYATSGAVTGEWEVTPTDNHKIDELTLAHSGDVLLVLLTTHEIVSNKPRSIRVESAALPGVYSVRAGMEEEEGASGAWQPTGEPGGVEVDYEQIRQIVKAEVDAAKTLIINNMISKTKAALQQEKVLTQPMFAGGQGDFEVSEQLKNRSYVGSLGALKTAGLYTGPIPGEEGPTP